MFCSKLCPSSRFALFPSTYLSPLLLKYVHGFIDRPNDRFRPRTKLPILRPNRHLRDSAAQSMYWRLCGISRRRPRDCEVCREVGRVVRGSAGMARGCQGLR